MWPNHTFHLFSKLSRASSVFLTDARVPSTSKSSPAVFSSSIPLEAMNCNARNMKVGGAHRIRGFPFNRSQLRHLTLSLVSLKVVIIKQPKMSNFMDSIKSTFSSSGEAEQEDEGNLITQVNHFQ